MKSPKSPKAIRQPRELALRCLLEVERSQSLVPEAMANCFEQLSDQDRQLAHEIVYGTFRYLPGLEQVLAKFVKKPKFPAEIRWLLLMSLYQLGFMRTPAYAIIDQANRLATRSRAPGFKGLVNGVLRNVGRAGEELWQDRQSMSWLLPKWLLARYTKQVGTQETASWCETWRERPYLCYWSTKTQPIEQDESSPRLPHGYRRRGALPGNLLETGGIYVQNEASQAIAELVCRSGGKTLLDLCAAPGGKVAYAAVFGSYEHLVAMEVSSVRAARMIENRTRLGLDFEIETQDALHPPANNTALFDRVLVDAPCTGLGIIGRHPEIKFLRKAPADSSLTSLQANLLQAGWQRLAPGGYLIYTVCSLDRAELPSPPEGAIIAKDQAQSWLSLDAHHEDWGFRISPDPYCDGFYGMVLQKPSEA